MNGGVVVRRLLQGGAVGALVLSLVGGVVACDDACMCTNDGEVSWGATVTDPSGVIVPDAKLYERFQDQEEHEVICSSRDSSGGCRAFQSRYAQVGTFHLRATRADGSSPTTLTFAVPGSITCCGPNPDRQSVTLVLPP